MGTDNANRIKLLMIVVIVLLIILILIVALFVRSYFGGISNYQMQNGSSVSPTTILSTTPTSTPTLTSTTVPFSVKSVYLTPNVASVSNLACGTKLTVTYTAVFNIPSGTPGGTVNFQYTINNGRSSTPASIVFAPGETSKVYTFTSAGTLTADHTFPGVAEVMVTAPNNVNSPQVTISGTCK